MRKKFVTIVLVAFVILCVWALWSTNKEVQNPYVPKISYHQFLKSNILSPSEHFCKKSPFFTIIVTSYVGHVELRSAHRRAMPTDILKSMNATRIFLLAKIPPTEKHLTQQAIENEHSIYNDLLQGSFIENYRNLTLKHLMGLKWVSNKCTPIYIVKVDDDIVFNLANTYKLLLSLGIQQNLLMGYMLNNTVPRRQKQNKWYVSEVEFTGSMYPSYLSGWYYITTSTVAKKISDEAIYHQFFWIDDIFITGILRKIVGIELKQVPKEFWLEYYELLECCITDMIKKSIQCPYTVGPNGGRVNLIIEFNKIIEQCNQWRNCSTKAIKPLKDTCIVGKERRIFSDGQGAVQLIKS
ncbi:hypothetical protein ACJJTC_009272 [Scirpophaga incertulas]